MSQFYTMYAYLILVLSVNCAAKNINYLDFNSVFPYTQSEDAFTSARLYIEKNLPQDIRNITGSKAREHYAFASIVKVASELAFAIRPTDPPQRYDPLKILYNCLPIEWDEYNLIANATKDFMAEILVKIEPVTKIIKKKCQSTTNLEECNKKVAITMKTSDSDIKKRAKLLLQLGKASDHVNSYSNLLDVIIADSQEIPYLKHHVQDPYVKKVMKDLAATYSLLQAIDF